MGSTLAALMAVEVIEHRLHINASPASVWAAISDPRRYAEWAVNTLQVLDVSGDLAEAGATYHQRNRIAGPLTGTSRWKVTTFEPPHRAVHRGVGIWVAQWMELEMIVDADGDGTQYTHRFSYEPAFGPAGSLMNVPLKRSVAHDMGRTAQALKALCELETNFL